MAIGCFFILMLGALVYRKVEAQLSGLTMGVTLALIAVLLASVVWLVSRSRGSPDAEAKDSEEAIAASNVESQLRAGALSPQDLVFDGRGWATLLESAQFGDVASELEAKLARKRQFKMALLIVCGLVACIGLLGLLANAGQFFDWLIFDR